MDRQELFVTLEFQTRQAYEALSRTLRTRSEQDANHSSLLYNGLHHTIDYATSRLTCKGYHRQLRWEHKNAGLLRPYILQHDLGDALALWAYYESHGEAKQIVSDRELRIASPQMLAARLGQRTGRHHPQVWNAAYALATKGEPSAVLALLERVRAGQDLELADG